MDTFLLTLDFEISKEYVDPVIGVTSGMKILTNPFK
jgi:hypothetical protein